ncbi:MAG: alpha-amylase/4-alpha-glucanotransferase domain-containing protein, partial [Azonexus sp.]
GLGAAHELSSYALAHNFGDTLRRYHEHYHDKIGKAPTEHQGEGIASAHDVIRFKHPVAPEDIVPDALPRALGLDELDGRSIDDYLPAAGSTLKFTRPGISKAWALNGSTATIAWQLKGLAGKHLTTRLNLAMPSCDGFLGRYVLADGSIPGGFGAALDLAAAKSLTLADGVLGGRIRVDITIPAEIHGRPHQTVSQSEAGFEKIMQAVELSVNWVIPDDACTLQLKLTIEPTPS